MIKELTTYTIICDGCGKDLNAESEFSGWNDKDYVIECSQEDNWFSEDGVKFYCPDCYDFDDDGEPEVKEHKGMTGK